MNHLVRPTALILLSLCIAPSVSSAAEWNRWRGPNGLGVAESTNLPVEFGPEKNVVWKTALPMGKSSPALTEDRIFLTAHENDQLLTICLDRKTGKILWRRPAPDRRLEKLNKLNDEASGSPVTDGENVYVFFGGYGMLSYGPDGNERWRMPLGPFTNFHGMGASPILADSKVIMICDQDENAFLIALNKDDGSVAWRAERPEAVHSFSTPIVYRPKDGPAEVVVPGSYQMTGYSLDKGEKLWWARVLTYQVKSVPVLDGDVIYFNGWAPGGEPDVRLVLPDFPEMLERFDGDKDGELSNTEIPKEWLPGSWDMQDLNKNGTLDARDWLYYQGRRTSENALLAIKLGGRGDVTASHVLWRFQKSLPDVPSVLLYKGLIYAIRNGGILTTLDPKTGDVVKQGRVRDAMDSYYASPVGADGKVYLASEVGKVSVLRAESDWTVLATNYLGEPIYATPAIEDGKIYLRTNSTLYCLGNAAQR